MPDADSTPDDPAALAEARKILGDRQFPVVITLAVPVVFGKETIETLSFNKGNFGVLKGLSIGVDRTPTLDELMMIASRLCLRPLKVIELLDPDDVDEVVGIALGFFGRCRGAGKRL